jgi:hypothetical protein
MRLPQSLMKTLLISASVLACGALPARGESAAARQLMADQLLEDARAIARDARMPLSLANGQALLLLKQARQLSPDSAEIAYATAEAARMAKDLVLEEAAVKDLVRLEPGNLVAQVRFLDLLAQRKQTVEQKMLVYQSALDSATLDGQVRSEMAMRLYRLLLQRGQTAEANVLLKNATDLNSTNVQALREVCVQLAHAHGRTTDYMQALVNLLVANPYQPEALLEGGDLLAAHNNHDAACDWMIAGLEQTQRQGVRPGLEVYESIAYELAAADRKVELGPLLQGMLAQEDASLRMLLLAYTLRAPQGVPPPPDDPLEARIRKQLDAAVTANPKSPDVLIDALWFDLFYSPAVPVTVTARMKTLEGMVSAADTRYQRLRGWQLLRSNQLKAAREILTPVSFKDVDAAFGLVRLAAMEGDKKAAAEGLQDLYSAHPTGLTALHIMAEARKEGVTLAQTALGQSLHDIAARYPQMLLTIHRQPRDIELIQASLSERRYKYGEPIVLDLTITNTSDQPLSVGPDGGIKVGIAVAGTLRGLGQQNIGAFAMDNNPRVFRLERHSSIESHIRIDQGALRQVLQANPTRLLNVSLEVISEPGGTPDRIVIGLGGQSVRTMSFERSGFMEVTPGALSKLMTDLPTLSLDQRMLDEGALAQLLPMIPDDAPKSDGALAVPSTEPTLAQVKQSIVDRLVASTKSDDMLEVGWLLRMAPNSVPQDLLEAIDKAKTGKSPLVRMLGYSRDANIATGNLDRQGEILAALRKAHESEADGTAKEWVGALIAQLTLPPPATAPATAPATTSAPATEPATAPATGPAPVQPSTTEPIAPPVSAPTATPATQP